MLKVSALRTLITAAGLALALSCPRDARAATVLYRTDAQLVAVSERVVHGRVLDVRVERAPGGRRTIYTVARIAVLEDFTGGADPVIEVRELGGAIDGEQMWVPGVPVFVPGQDIVLCLERAGASGAGRWRTVAMEFSAFRVDPQADGDAMLTRDAAASTIIGAPAVNDGRSRRLSEFRRVVSTVKGVSPVRPGGERAIEEQQARDAAAAAAGERVSSEFTLLADMRWRQADSDTVVTWYKNPSAPAPTTAPDVDQRIAKATEAWTLPATARLSLAYGGTRSAGSEDVDCSSVNAGAGLITFEDPYNEINGSVIAIGGGCSGGPSHVVNNHTFSSITHAFVIFQNASELSAGIRSPDSFMRVLAHEIGHGIGLGHTCDPSSGTPCTVAMQSNLMYPSCCASAMPLPPQIGPDDLAGIEYIYPMPAGPAPDPDTDDDGLPNDWETQFGLNPNSSASPNGADGDPDGDLIPNSDEYAKGTHPRGFEKRYFAEGVVNSFFETQIALLNPGATAARVLLRLQPQSGSEVPYFIDVPGGSRRTVSSAAIGAIMPAPFSTLIESDVPVVADRTVAWAGGAGYGSHTETAVLSSAATWYLAEGATGGGFDLYYLVQNSNDAAVQIQVTYLLPFGQTPLVKNYEVPGKSRMTIWVDEEVFPGSPAKPLSATDVSAKVVSSGGPIIVERAMYYSAPGAPVYTAGHESAGVPEVAGQTRLEWFFAEGATGSFFDTYILLANPGTAAANINATYLLPDGASFTKTYSVPRESRFTIRVDDEEIPAGSGIRPLQNTSVSTALSSNVPVIAERSMWWPDGQWYEAHNTVGAQSRGTRWAVAEGEIGGARGAQTFLLVANDGNQAANIRITVMTETGVAIPWPSATTTFPVPARSRHTVAVDPGLFPNITQRFGAVVESVNAQPIVVERSNYYNIGGVLWSSGGAALASKISTP
jgi:hypothetical protein